MEGLHGHDSSVVHGVGDFVGTRSRGYVVGVVVLQSVGVVFGVRKLWWEDGQVQAW